MEPRLVRGRGSNKSKWLLPITFLVCCAICFAVIFLSPPVLTLPADASGIRLPIGYDPRLDPPLGSELPERILEISSSKFDGIEELLLVYAGSCSGCSVKTISTDQLLNLGFERVIVVFEASDDDIEESFALLQLTPNENIATVPDPTATLRRNLNSAWVPRYYIYSHNKLSWLQSHPDSWPPPTERSSL